MAGSRILVLNAGSSSLKAALIESPDHTVARATVPWSADVSRTSDRAAGLSTALIELGLRRGSAGVTGIDAVGYRVVHGGTRFTRPALIDADVIAGIEFVADLAPLHNAIALETIKAGRALLPNVPHVASFDTAFHSTLPVDALRYPVPERWYADWGIRRYGFHGLSVAWATRRAAQILGRAVSELDLVVAHLGSGCSVTAVSAGRSVDTSMGMTPLEGLMMGTRSGSIDPGLVFYLIDGAHMSAGDVSDALEHDSGLLGVSGTSSDMRELQEATAAGDERAALAISMFVRRAAAGIASAATSLARLDAIVFSGGIGEHASMVRRRIVERISVLGVNPLRGDPSGDGDIRLDTGDQPVAVLRIEAREDLVIAADTAAMIGLGTVTDRDIPRDGG